MADSVITQEQLSKIIASQADNIPLSVIKSKLLASISLTDEDKRGLHEGIVEVMENESPNQAARYLIEALEVVLQRKTDMVIDKFEEYLDECGRPSVSSSKSQAAGKAGGKPGMFRRIG